MSAEVAWSLGSLIYHFAHGEEEGGAFASPLLELYFGSLVPRQMKF